MMNYFLIRNVKWVPFVFVMFLATSCDNWSDDTSIHIRRSHFQLLIADNIDKRRFDIWLESTTDREICAPLDSWPNMDGQLHFKGDSVFVQAGGREFFMKDRNLGSCGPKKPDGGINDCPTRLFVSGIIESHIPYTEFDEAMFDYFDAKKILHYTPTLYYCSDDDVT
jgi:hypothetical protein